MGTHAKMILNYQKLNQSRLQLVLLTRIDHDIYYQSPWLLLLNIAMLRS